jgi:hypothetical protein
VQVNEAQPQTQSKVIKRVADSSTQTQRNEDEHRFKPQRNTKSESTTVKLGPSFKKDVVSLSVIGLIIHSSPNWKGS